MVDPARSRPERIRDTLGRLAHDVDAWFASTDGERPWLVPLCFAWYDGRIVAATDAASRTALNLASHPDVRICLDGSRDVVLIDGRVELTTPGALAPDELAVLTAKLESDPRTWADVALRVTPVRIQAWREENELAGRLLMRDGAWLDPPSGIHPDDRAR